MSNLMVQCSNNVENSINCVSESPTGGVTPTIKAEAGSTTLPTSSPPGDEAVVECRYPDGLLPASITPPRPPGGGEAKAKVTNIPTTEAVPDKKFPQKKINFQKFSKLNFDPVQPPVKFAPMFSTFPCSRPKSQTNTDVPINDFKEKVSIRKKEIADNVQQSNRNKVNESNPNKIEEEEVIPSNPEADDNATAIGGVCSLDSKDDRAPSGTRARQNCSPSSGQFEQPTSQSRDEL